MDGRSRSENRKASRLLTVADNIDRDRLTNVRVELRKIRLEELGPGGTFKLTKKPFLRSEKRHVPHRLLSELKKEVRGIYRNKLEVKVVVDDEIDLINEAHAQQRKKKEKLKVRVIQDSQTVVVEEISLKGRMSSH